MFSLTPKEKFAWGAGEVEISDFLRLVGDNSHFLVLDVDIHGLFGR